VGDERTEAVMLTLSALSKEWVKVPVQVTESGVGRDPTGDTVQMAFVAHGVNPGSSDWKAAAWETADGIYLARCLVGPAAVVLAVGTYAVWVKVTDNPEVPVLRVGSLTVE
jgi:hypothetical protein